MDERLLEIFRTEATERLDRMSATLLAAEHGGGDEEAIAELFRDAHSIKGSAAMFGLDDAAALAGAMEDLLAPAREGGTLPAQLAPRLLDAADALRAAVHGDTASLAPALARLTGAQAADRPPSDAPGPSAPSPEPELIARPTAATVDPSTARFLRVRADKVDRLLDSVGETALHRRRLEHLSEAQTAGTEPLRQELERGESLVMDLQDAVLGLRTLPLETIVGPLPRAVRDMAAEAGRDVRLELAGTDVPLDRTILEGISEVLVHLLRNAVAHGIEPPAQREAAGKPRTGTIRIHAEHRGGTIAITCSDDGRGVSPELLARASAEGSLAAVLAEAGTSSADVVSDLSGRGVGLDAVQTHIEALAGSLEISSRPGAGTDVTLVLPLTLAIVRMLLIERGGQAFGLPLTGVERAARDVTVHYLHGQRELEHEGQTMPMADLADVLGAGAPALEPDGPVVIVASGGRRVAVQCDRLLGEGEVVVKSLGTLLGKLPQYLGGAILDDGGVALLLDPAHVARATAGATTSQRAAAPSVRRAPKVLVVDDQFTVRELERTILEAAGYRVATAEDGRTALAALAREQDVDCVVSDVEMPGMNGLELLEAVRAQPERAALPFVIVTSRDDAQARSRGADAGADAWVIKSQFDQQALLDTVGGLVALP